MKSVVFFCRRCHKEVRVNAVAEIDAKHLCSDCKDWQKLQELDNGK